MSETLKTKHLTLNPGTSTQVPKPVTQYSPKNNCRSSHHKQQHMQKKEASKYKIRYLLAKESDQLYKPN